MLKTVEMSRAKKTAGIAVTYRAGKGDMFGTCPASCNLNDSGDGAENVDNEYLDALLNAKPKKGFSFTYCHFHWSKWINKARAIAKTVINYSADNLADILNTYMEVMTDIANKHGAVLDKFIGDGMVCFFGEPNSRGVRQDALDCVAMAIDMRREMRSLRQKWRLMGFDGLYVRIGITTGYCHVGNFGSSSRLNYTIIGREANRAARLEQAAGNDEILISQATYDYICHDYQCKYAISYKLKGFDDVIRAWQVLDPDADKDESSKWVDHTLPGFNLHLNFKDMKNYDYQEIRNRLNFALERIEKEESDQMSGR